MNVSARRAWKRKVMRTGRNKAGPSSWLWTNVVELMARHERAYLEHCAGIKFA